jgi:acyl-[acyl carrier protein]--UDP-N-acetylglucosamine O-acyltransferase
MNSVHYTCIPAQQQTPVILTAGYTIGHRNTVREFTCIHNSTDEKQPTRD